MRHRLSAGAIVEHEGRVLLVRHKKPAEYDFWVAPGGGVQSNEELTTTAEREVREETGLNVAIGRMLYIEEFYNPEVRHCKFWFAATFISGTISTAAPEATAEYIVEAAWHSQDEIANLQVFPSVLQGRYWSDCLREVQLPHYLGLREMKFW